MRPWERKSLPEGAGRLPRDHVQEATAGGLLGCRDHTTKLTCVRARWFAYRETELVRRVRRRELPRVTLPAWVLALAKPGEPREYQRQVPFLEFRREGWAKALKLFKYTVHREYYINDVN